MKTPETTLKISFAGNPNSGKSTLFNALTGLRQKTGNFPGVTVDKKTARLKGNQGHVLELTDLPGTYSLFPKSLDERITADIILNPAHPDHPDLILVIADASNIHRSLYLASQIQETGIPFVFVLNMIDMARKAGKNLKTDKIHAYLGAPVFACNSREGEGITALESFIKNYVPANEKKPVNTAVFLGKDENYQKEDSIRRFEKISALADEITGGNAFRFDPRSQKIDKVLTHPIYGYLFFFLILFTIFQAIFYLAPYPMEWIESGFLYLGAWLGHLLPENLLSDLLLNGILPGLSGVMMFIPQIALLFLFLTILEDTGYMARASFIMDRALKKFGLNGRTVIPLMSGIACAIPAVMSARTISSARERLLTILITPLMSCSARLPVYTLLIALVIPDRTVAGIFNLQGLTLMGLYLLGFFAALGMALIYKIFIKGRERSFFIMELPVYRKPKWNNIGLLIREKVGLFVVDAGKVILAISIILWALANFGPGDRMETAMATWSDSVSAYPDKTDFYRSKMESVKLENSFAGILGKSIEPVIKPLGFDWKIGIALITSFAAREVFVGTMATLYAAGDDNNPEPLREKLMNLQDEKGNKVYSLATGLSLMIFYAFALQCMSTVAVVKRETGGWKWPLIQLFSFLLLAYFSSLAVYGFLS